MRRSFATLDEQHASLRGSHSLAELLARLPASQREEAWREIDAGFEQYCGPTGVVIAGRQVLLSATA